MRFKTRQEHHHASTVRVLQKGLGSQKKNERFEIRNFEWGGEREGKEKGHRRRSRRDDPSCAEKRFESSRPRGAGLPPPPAAYVKSPPRRSAGIASTPAKKIDSFYVTILL
ncbi:hypothetical protein EVAR_22757_1 [Eumeta japonica]|uniref:Uncharacterized protein n=1 Tax=Eumeta variegata TaxID=151549 RepID=A0A4C1USF8_EUMVA|nr:hypothetical protein EVAR_22757_1 [Eumeta japonica]